MKLIFSNHAKNRMIEREIKIKEVQGAIDFSDYNVSTGNKIESHKKIKDKILKVVYIRKENYIKIITLMWK